MISKTELVVGKGLINKMCKRKCPGRELKLPSRPTSAELSSSTSSGEWPELSSSSSASSVSCTSKMPKESEEENEQRENSTPETKAMDLVGCPRCFMYVMLSEVDPKCPKCKTTVFLELFKDENLKTNS
ncbi:hypothetical protein JHK84_034668 [Glycine max]|nr:hypothetical protein JHK85_035041 [Glycine max]KAG4986710.1 hypothetical protein JHK86_034401 [Glycine max]KAG5140900.1 hypothetical protein JHK84_034668 [Glycine max]